MSWNDYNKRVIDEFRANDGKVGGPFAGAPMVLLHHRGARTGTVRVTPLVTRTQDDAWVVFGSKGGAPNHPHWVLNLRANPDAVIEFGTDTVDVRAREATGDERERIWTSQKQDVPTFAEYEGKAGDREIPVVILEPR